MEKEIMILEKRISKSVSPLEERDSIVQDGQAIEIPFKENSLEEVS